MSERIEMPSEEDQRMRWARDQCALCAEPLPPDAGYSSKFCGATCRKTMTKLRRQGATQ